MYKDMEWFIFGTVRFFRKKIQKFLAAPPARIIITPADNLCARGYFFTRAACRTFALPIALAPLY